MMAGAAPNEGRHPSRSTATIIVTCSSYSPLTISLLSKRLCPSVCVWLVAFVHRDELVGACHINLAALNPVVALKGNSNIRTRIATVTDVMDNIMIATAARIFSAVAGATRSG